ncbi:sensor histidine kinase [Sphingobacterium sp. HMA12]|uniref:sensor histidine kinase n=1 Tax=Sphingobacterium sp. HMA12 TaxID=2050894 RepID=UPI000CE9DA10|nr:sensor histidine kinase [Sphingobacterium sp. HMA12]
MKANLRILFRNWFTHLLIVWIILNLSSIVSFINRSNRDVAFTNQDGSPIPLWQYFGNYNFHLSDIVVMALFLFLAEVNYLFLFKRIHWLLLLLTSLSTGTATFIVLALIHPERIRILGLISGTAPILMMSAYALVYAIIRDYYYDIRNQKEIKLQQSKNELDALKAQLNPHFLFNCLNYLYGTALNEKAPTTADGIDKLSTMMRYTITGIHETFVSLEKELGFINHYLDLQQVRLPQKDNIKISIEIQSTEKHLSIAPLILLPFIENVFKYGISLEAPCFIKIKIAIINHTVIMETYNNIFSHTNEVKGNNTGIKNTVKRLNLLYPNRYKLEQSNSNNQYKTRLTLKLEN